jgi:drug/metabolite transporter (DMT)-like permease
MSGILLAVLASLFWGFNGIFLRKGLEGKDVVSGTITVVSVTVMVLFIFSLPYIHSLHIDHIRLAMLGIAGVISYFVGRLFTYSSVASIGSSRAFSGTSTRILFSSILGFTVLSEYMSFELISGILLMSLGLYIFSTEDVSRTGIYSSVAGGFAYGLAALFVKVAMLESPVVTSFVVSLSGLIFLLIFANLRGKLSLIKNRYLAASGISLAAGNISYYYALSTTPLSIVVPLSNLYPLVTTALSFLLIQKLELVTSKTFIGSFMAVAGSIMIAASV